MNSLDQDEIIIINNSENYKNNFQNKFNKINNTTVLCNKIDYNDKDNEDILSKRNTYFVKNKNLDLYINKN
jgi:hypothetical protein